MSKQNPDDAPHEIAAGTVIDGRYRIVRPLGHGGNGMVHEVVHLMTGRHLALKSLLDETGLGRLEQEARASSLMKNGHTAKITDMGTNGPAGPYLVMELLEGQSLRGLLDEAGQLPLELTVNIALQVCECLTEAHGHGIIHRDLKPENVFLCASNWPGQYDVKVLDFGIVKIDGEGAIPKSSLTRTGSTVGTPYYMSLEQLRNSSAVDVRADVYSLGVVIYECLSGRKPFQAETIGDLVFALCSGPPTHLGRLRPDLPADVCDMVMRTLSINRDDRPPTMPDFAIALLPQGNSAFGMWIRSDGRPRDPTRSLSQGAGAITPSALLALSAPLPQVRQPMSPLTQPPPPGSLVPLPPVEGEPARSNFKSTVKMPPHEAPPKPQRPQMDSEPSGDRDTPTEMFRKAAHDGPDPDLGLEPRAPARDRDTPTSAFRADLPLPELRSERPERPERPFLQTMKSPGNGPGESGSGIPAPRFGGPPSIEDSQSNAWTEGVPNHDPMTSAPTLDPRSIGAIPMPRVSSPNLILSTLPLIPRMDEPYTGQAAPTNKPGWQLSLDRALTRVGSLIEDSIKRFRAAPQSTQLAIAIAAAGAVLLILSLLLLVMIH